jgi:hypothetical protein
VLTSQLLLAAALATQTPSTAPALDGAQSAQKKGDAEGCLRGVTTTLQSGSLHEDDLAAAWVLRGRCYQLQGDADRAERAYAVALRVRRDLPVPKDDKGAFALARQTLPDAAVALALEARTARHGDDDAVELVLLADDLQLVKTVQLAKLSAPADELARAPLDLVSARHTVSGIDVHGLEARVLDKYGNVLLRMPVVDATAPLPSTPHVATVTTSTVVGPTWVTGLGGTLLLLGAGGMTGTGMALTNVNATTPNASLTPPLLAGLSVSGAVAILGGILVVMDQAPPATPKATTTTPAAPAAPAAPATPATPAATPATDAAPTTTPAPATAAPTAAAASAPAAPTAAVGR